LPALKLFGRIKTMAISMNWQNKRRFNVGDTISVDYKISEQGKKDRSQIFAGVIISIKGSGENKTFTVRKISADNLGVERIFPTNSPWIIEIKLIKTPKNRPRRAKLYYLRSKVGKKKKK